jgi:GNAT acetyltransferase-like protein
LEAIRKMRVIKGSGLALTARAATAAEWDAMFAACDHATFFHSREWAEVWQRYTSGQVEPAAWSLSFSDGTSALLPVARMRFHAGLTMHYISSPADTYGGWLSTDELTGPHRELLLAHMRRRMPNLSLRVNPFDAFTAGVNFGAVAHDETHALWLKDDFESIEKGFSRGHRSAIRAARKNGVTVSLATELEQWKTYYSAYEDSLRRWGTRTSSRYTWSLFDELFRLASPCVRLWIAERDEELLAGALCFYARSHVGWWHGAAFESAFHLRPVNLLLADVIRDASLHGYSWFDFNPSGGHAGVEEFKRRFGARPLAAPVLRTGTSWRRAGRKMNTLKHVVARNLAWLTNR